MILVKIDAMGADYANPQPTPNSVDPSPPSDFGRIFTFPNFISIARLASIAVFIWLLFDVGDRWTAALLWGALGATDWVDGWWARRFNSVSELGKILDPVSDRVVLIVAVFAVGIDGSVPWWLVIATLAREVSMSIIIPILNAMGVPRLNVTWWGKCATFGLYFAFPLLLAGAADPAHLNASIAEAMRIAGWVCAAPSLIFSYASAIQYLNIGIATLRQARST